jgi:predicted AAA+ superfamily ATPase
MNEKNKIKNIILGYCEGDTDKYWLEFPRDDLPEMVEKIKRALLDEIQKAPHTWEDAIDVIREF